MSKALNILRIGKIEKDISKMQKKIDKLTQEIRNISLSFSKTAPDRSVEENY